MEKHNLEELLTECYIWLDYIAENECACESSNYYEPEFICGIHRLIIRIEDALGEE